VSDRWMGVLGNVALGLVWTGEAYFHPLGWKHWLFVFLVGGQCFNLGAMTARRPARGKGETT
jgi:hypothetical protein